VPSRPGDAAAASTTAAASAAAAVSAATAAAAPAAAAATATTAVRDIVRHDARFDLAVLLRHPVRENALHLGKRAAVLVVQPLRQRTLVHLRLFDHGHLLVSQLLHQRPHLALQVAGPGRHGVPWRHIERVVSHGSSAAI